MPLHWTHKTIVELDLQLAISELIRMQMKRVSKHSRQNIRVAYTNFMLLNLISNHLAVIPNKK